MGECQKEYHRERKGHNINRNKVYSMTIIYMLKWNFTKIWLTPIQWYVSCYGLSRAPQDGNSNNLSCAINNRNISWRVAAGKGTPWKKSEKLILIFTILIHRYRPNILFILYIFPTIIRSTFNVPNQALNIIQCFHLTNWWMDRYCQLQLKISFNFFIFFNAYTCNYWKPKCNYCNTLLVVGGK